MSKASSSAAGKNRGFVWPAARRPAWILDSELEWLPDDTRQEVVALVASSYQELVVEAASALERAAGEEFVFLFWLSLVRSLRLRGHSRPGDVSLFGTHPDTEVQYYLQLGLAKQRVLNLILRVKEWHARWQREAARQAVVAPGDAPRIVAAEAGPPQLVDHPPAPDPLSANRPEHGPSNGQSPGDARAAGKAARDARVTGPAKAEKAASGAAMSRIGNCPGPHPSALPAGAGVDQGPPQHVGLRCDPPEVAAEDGLEKPKSEGQQANGLLEPLPAAP